MPHAQKKFLLPLSTSQRRNQRAHINFKSLNIVARTFSLSDINIP